MPQALHCEKRAILVPTFTHNEPDTVFPLKGVTDTNPVIRHTSHRSDQGHGVPHRSSNRTCQKIFVFMKQKQNCREYAQPGQLYTWHVLCAYQACSLRPQQADFSRDANTWVPTPVPQPTSLAETAARLHTCCWTRQPFGAALCHSSKTIYTLTFSWCLPQFSYVAEKKNFLLPCSAVRSIHVQHSTCSLIYFMAIPQGPDSDSSSFQRHLSRVWLNQTNLETST